MRISPPNFFHSPNKPSHPGVGGCGVGLTNPLIRGGCILWKHDLRVIERFFSPYREFKEFINDKNIKTKGFKCSDFYPINLE